MTDLQFGVFIPQGWKMELATIADPIDKWQHAVDIAQLAEELGYDSLWVYDHFHNVPVPAHETMFECWMTLAAISQRTTTIKLGQMVGCAPYREPSLLAKLTSNLDVMSGGRLIWGIGAGWYQHEFTGYGYEFLAPADRIRMLAETVEIVTAMWSEPDVSYDGRYYQLPLPADQGTGLGKPLKLINRPVRSDIPIYIASLGPKNIQMTAEIAEGWLPIFFHPEKAAEVWSEDLEIGKAKRDPELGELEVVAGGVVSICDDASAQALRDAGRGMTALYVGGMGAKGKNFYNTLFQKYGLSVDDMSTALTEINAESEGFAEIQAQVNKLIAEGAGEVGRNEKVELGSTVMFALLLVLASVFLFLLLLCCCCYHSSSSCSSAAAAAAAAPPGGRA